MDFCVSLKLSGVQLKTAVFEVALCLFTPRKLVNKLIQTWMNTVLYSPC